MAEIEPPGEGNHGGEIEVDVEVTNHGSIMTFKPLTERAREWMRVHIPEEAQWIGGACVVEPRYAGELADGMLGDGLEVV